MAPSTKTSSGVQKLVERLHEEGVASGQKEGNQIVEKARQEAAQIVADSRKEAEDLLSKAHTDIEREKVAARSALQMAARDTVLRMRSEVAKRFQAQVGRLVTEELRDKEFLRRLIVEVAGKSMAEIPSDQAMEILVADKSGVDQMVREISVEMLREGIEIKPSGDDQVGIRAKLTGENVEVDMTDGAILEALVKHLLPRFRYIVQGIQESD